MKQMIDSLIDDAVNLSLVRERDRIYLTNQILQYIPEEIYNNRYLIPEDESPNSKVEAIVQCLADEGVIENKVYIKDIFSANIMNVMLPFPSGIENRFNKLKAQDSVKATDDFYNISLFSNYIQKNRIKQNISFKADSRYGELEVTINLSKPEKSIEEIKEAQSVKQDSQYPACFLCKENEGYVGNLSHPARSNHRVLGITLDNRQWYLQFSPYSYYDEHSIVFTAEHVPMKINTQTFINLADFVDQFPHYFIGSNADLPIVGGSMLSHEHYQAGKHVFPIERAESFYKEELMDNVTVELLNWPLSTVKISGEDKEAVIQAAVRVTDNWNQYDNEALNIKSKTNEQHSTVTPIVRKENDRYIAYIILRNNRTDEQNPYGIFHVNPEDFHIKKENIGLIEAMGLAVLPARLKDDAEKLESHFKSNTFEETEHNEWIQVWQEKYDKDYIAKNFDDVFQRETGHKFENILEACGVFKSNEDFISFIHHIDFNDNENSL